MKEKQARGHPLTDEEIREITLRVLKNEYMVIDTDEKLSVCLQIDLKQNGPITDEEGEAVGMVIGDLSSALPFDIQGLPLFTRVIYVNKDDWKRVQLMHVDCKQALADVEVPK